MLTLCILALILSGSALVVAIKALNQTKPQPHEVGYYVKCTRCNREIPVYKDEPAGPRECHFCRARKK